MLVSNRNTSMKSILNIILAIVIVVVIVILIGRAKGNNPTQQGVLDLEPRLAGNIEAPLALIEYADFQCPACASYHTLVQQVLEEYGDRISFEFRHLPLSSIHPVAIPAARAAEAAAQQGKFWEMHDLLFERQDVWSRSVGANGLFIKYAEELDLDVDQFRSHLKNKEITQHIAKSRDLAQELGITSTPTFILGGELIQNPGTLEEFSALIEAQLALVSSE